jgi:hypothetical protein
MGGHAAPVAPGVLGEADGLAGLDRHGYPGQAGQLPGGEVGGELVLCEPPPVLLAPTAPEVAAAGDLLELFGLVTDERSGQAGIIQSRGAGGLVPAARRQTGTPPSKATIWPMTTTPSNDN